MSEDETTRDPAGPVEASGAPIEAEAILAVRRGPGANCSSIGSALDLLFLSSVAAGAVLVAVAAALEDGTAKKDAAREERAPRVEEPGDAGAR
jgi:hypothetical protein